MELATGSCDYCGQLDCMSCQEYVDAPASKPVAFIDSHNCTDKPKDWNARRWFVFTEDADQDATLVDLVSHLCIADLALIAAARGADVRVEMYDDGVHGWSAAMARGAELIDLARARDGIPNESRPFDSSAGRASTR